MANHYPNLNPEKALIWPIVRRANVPWTEAGSRATPTASVKSFFRESLFQGLPYSIEKMVAGALPAICRRCPYMTRVKRVRLAGGSPSARSEQIAW